MDQSTLLIPTEFISSVISALMSLFIPLLKSFSAASFKDFLQQIFQPRLREQVDRKEVRVMLLEQFQNLFVVHVFRGLVVQGNSIDEQQNIYQDAEEEELHHPKGKQARLEDFKHKRAGLKDHRVVLQVDNSTLASRRSSQFRTRHLFIRYK